MLSSRSVSSFRFLKSTVSSFFIQSGLFLPNSTNTTLSFLRAVILSHHQNSFHSLSNKSSIQWYFFILRSILSSSILETRSVCSFILRSSFLLLVTLTPIHFAVWRSVSLSSVRCPPGKYGTSTPVSYSKLSKNDRYS